MQGVKRFPQRLPKWRWAVLGVLGLLAVGVAGRWWPSAAGEASGGTPRLVMDQTEVDLGDRQFDTPARAVFTLSNAGDSALIIVEEPSVEVVKGC